MRLSTLRIMLKHGPKLRTVEPFRLTGRQAFALRLVWDAACRVEADQVKISCAESVEFGVADYSKEVV